ncbi:MAG: hypothetical protein IKN86_12375 [Bacteroidaceae bacterium]|nr:hypothetical protein [Bacteroidaceae bacterium]
MTKYDSRFVNIRDVKMAIRVLKNARDKDEFMALLESLLESIPTVERYPRHGNWGGVGDWVNIWYSKCKTPQQMKDTIENMIDILETTDDEKLKLNPMRVKWLKEWAQGSPTQSLIKEPQEGKEQPQPTREKGRPKETFKDKMIDDANGSKLQKIHTKLDRKKGKDAALIILACIEKGWVMRPTYTQVKNEFGDVGSKTGYNKYLNKDLFTEEELEGAKNSLD